MNFKSYGIRFRSARLAKAIEPMTAIAVLLVLNTSASAATLLSADSSSNVGAATPGQTGSSGTISDSAGGQVQTDLAIARTSATFGELKAYSFTSSGTNRAFFGIVATNTASFKDDWLIDAPGKTGTTGFVDVKFKIDGTLEASRVGPAGYQAGYDGSVSASAGYLYSWGVNGSQGSVRKIEGMSTPEWAAANGFPQHSGSFFLGIEQTITVPFTYGTLLESVGLELTTQSKSIGNPNFSSLGMADLEHTAKWGGFGAVRDANGNIVTDYTFWSGSGVDFTQDIAAVPEPSSWALMAAGVGLCFLRKANFSRKRK